MCIKGPLIHSRSHLARFIEVTSIKIEKPPRGLSTEHITRFGSKDTPRRRANRQPPPARKRAPGKPKQYKGQCRENNAAVWITRGSGGSFWAPLQNRQFCRRGRSRLRHYAHSIPPTAKEPNQQHPASPPRVPRGMSHRPWPQAESERLAGPQSPSPQPAGSCLDQRQE
jgi:hypothetical protein